MKKYTAKSFTKLDFKKRQWTITSFSNLITFKQQYCVRSKSKEFSILSQILPDQRRCLMKNIWAEEAHTMISMSVLTDSSHQPSGTSSTNGHLSITGNSIRQLTSSSILSFNNRKSLLLLCSYSVQAVFCVWKMRLASIFKMFPFLISQVSQKFGFGGRKEGYG